MIVFLLSEILIKTIACTLSPEVGGFCRYLLVELSLLIVVA